MSLDTVYPLNRERGTQWIIVGDGEEFEPQRHRGHRERQKSQESKRITKTRKYENTKKSAEKARFLPQFPFVFSFFRVFVIRFVFLCVSVPLWFKFFSVPYNDPLSSAFTIQ